MVLSILEHVSFGMNMVGEVCSGATAAVAGQHAKEGQITVVEDSHKHLFKGVSIWVDGFTIPSHQVHVSPYPCTEYWF